MNYFKSDKGKQVVLGIPSDNRNTFISLGELKRGKHQTNEAALREWAETSGKKSGLCVVATIDTDRYRVTTRVVADIEVVPKVGTVVPRLSEAPRLSEPVPVEDEIEVRHE